MQSLCTSINKYIFKLIYTHTYVYTFTYTYHKLIVSLKFNVPLLFIAHSVSV